MADRKILQIIPADGWVARISENGSEKKLLWPLVCWALVANDEGETEIVGMDAYRNNEVVFFDQNPDFDGYFHAKGLQLDPAATH